MIKKYKQDKILEENKKKEKDLDRKRKKEALLQEELERRKVEVGVPGQKKGIRQELKALIYESDQV